MDKRPFEASLLKLERGRKHIVDFMAVINAYLKTGFFKLSVDSDRQGASRLKFEVNAPLPRDVPLIVGDAIHNLRASLDLAVCEAVNLAKATRNTKFPFAATENDFRNLLKRDDGGLKEHCPKIYDYIVNEVKPYKGGSDNLYGLHELDIVDKHKLLIPVVSIVALNGVSAEDDRGGSFTGLNIFINQNGTLNLIRDAAKLKITNYGKARFEVLFDKGHIFEGKPFVPTLNELANKIDVILNEMEKRL
jgi:hypothetical protein